MRSFSPRPPSRRARGAAAVSHHALRPVTRAVPSGPVGVAVARALLATSLRTLSPRLDGTSYEPVVEPVGGGQVRGEWVLAPGATGNHDIGGAVVLYLHGSAYAACSPATHRGIVSRLSGHSGLPAFSVDYRLAPRHRFPRAADDVRRAWDWLRRTHDASDIVVAGDSAGGHLAVDLCLQLRRAGEPLPAAQLLFSPVADLTFTLAEARERLRPDPFASAAAGRRLVHGYCGSAGPADPRLTHVIATDETLPPTLIQVGGTEMLAADAHHLHRALRASGTDVHLEVWPGQLHVFQALPRLVPEAEPALRRAAAFAHEHVYGSARRRAGVTEPVRDERATA